MRVLKDAIATQFDLAIYGLGYESRAVAQLKKIDINSSCQSLAIGYVDNTSAYSYKKNKSEFIEQGCTIKEVNDSEVKNILAEFTKKLDPKERYNVSIDITVMSRHRLAVVIDFFISLLPKSSIITISYSLSEYVEPPVEHTPVRIVDSIFDGLAGSLGDLNLPTSIVIGLGYEKEKALGIVSYLDAHSTYVFIPKSPVSQFEKDVMKSNIELLESIPANMQFHYDVQSPYSTYVDLKSLILSLSDFSRPLLIPLGPKILAAICVVLGVEMKPKLPIWRVSSEHTEKPVDRKASGYSIKFSIEL